MRILRMITGQRGKLRQTIRTLERMGGRDAGYLIIAMILGGWNGLQLLLFDQFIFLSLDELSFANFITSLLAHPSSVRLVLFITSTALLVALYGKCAAEVYTIGIISRVQPNRKTRFQMVTLLFIHALALFMGTFIVSFLLFLLYKFLMIILPDGFLFTPTGAEFPLTTFLLGGYVFMLLYQMLVFDWVVYFVIRGKTIGEAVNAMLSIIQKNMWEILIYYVGRIFLMILSIAIFIITYRFYGAIIAYAWHLEGVRAGLFPFTSMNYLLKNLGIIGLFVTTSLLIGVPVNFFLYIYHKVCFNYRHLESYMEETDC
ncbi:MAG: hypothetical protein K8S56_01675 [Candidatus Cloacimonetes bacterium]|nr:hypothetical protein [Candidatus Cloacimonadota bacterium]